MADVLVLYGSMTGSAQEIARRIHEEAEDAGMSSELTPMNKWKDFDFASYQATVFIVSTTGNGDAPDHAETGCDKFWRFIKRRSQPADLFEGTQFTVLGLGDTNYDKFWCVCTRCFLSSSSSSSVLRRFLFPPPPQSDYVCCFSPPPLTIHHPTILPLSWHALGFE